MRKDIIKFVYLIQNTVTRHLKIGCTSNTMARLAHLQTASSEKLELLYVIRGDFQKERFLHSRFSEHRLHGEWFANSEEIKGYFIDKQFILNVTPTPALPPRPRRLGRNARRIAAKRARKAGQAEQAGE